MAEKIQGKNDQERVLYIAKTFGKTEKIPPTEIASASADGATVITVQGTKVNNALLEGALTEEKARAAAARAASGVPADVATKDEVAQMINDAVAKALADQRQAPPK